MEVFFVVVEKELLLLPPVMKKSRARRINSAPLPCITSSFTPHAKKKMKRISSSSSSSSSSFVFFFFFFFFCFLLFFFFFCFLLFFFFFVETKHKNSKKAKKNFRVFFQKEKKRKEKTARLHKKKEGGINHTHLYSLVIIYMHACICGLANGLGVNVATELSLLLLPHVLLNEKSSSSSGDGNDDDDDDKSKSSSSSSSSELKEGCFVTRITLCDSALNNNIAAKSSFSKEEEEEKDDLVNTNTFVTEKDVALSGGVLLKSDIGDRKSVALCRRLRARLVLASSSEGEEKKESIIVDVAEDCSFFSSLSSSSSPSSPPPIDVLFFCDGAGPLSVACNANERLRSRKGGEESRLDHQRQQLQQRPIFVYCTVEHHGSDNNTSHSGRNSSSGGGGGEVGTIFVDDGSGYDVDEEAEKNSGDDKATASKALYDALRPQFTALFANALDEAGAGNVDEDENRRRERRAALHWEFLKKTPEATPLLHAVSERSGDKNKDKFLSSSASSTVVRQRDSGDNRSISSRSNVFLPMTLLVAHTATFAVTQIVKRRREAYLNMVMSSLNVSENEEDIDKKKKEEEDALAKTSVVGAEQWTHLDIFDCVKNVEKDFVSAPEGEKTKEAGYETITTDGIDVAMEDDPKDAILKHAGFDAVENIRKRCKIAIVGSGILTAALATCFASIGVSEIALIGDASDPRNINLPRVARHPLLSAFVGDPMFTLSECENDANAMALNERFPGTKSYFLSRGEDEEAKDNNKFDIIVHVEGDAPFAKKSESESPTTTSKAMIPKIEAGFAIRCGVVGDNQVGIVEVNRANSKYAWTKCTDTSLSFLVSSTVSLEIIRWAKGGRNKERLVYVNARGRGADAFSL